MWIIFIAENKVINKNLVNQQINNIFILPEIKNAKVLRFKSMVKNTQILLNLLWKFFLSGEKEEKFYLEIAITGLLLSIASFLV